MSTTITYYDNVQISHVSRRIMLGEIDDALKNAESLNSKGDYYDIVAHGSSTQMHPKVNGAHKPLSANVVYAMLCKQPDYHDQPIRLISCWVGLEADGFAQQLANLAGVPVLAATAKILVVAGEPCFYDPRDFGEPVRPSDLGPKKWIVYHPQMHA